MTMGDGLRGARVGSYQLHQRLAVGGACEVYLAKHLQKDLWCAVKVLKEEHLQQKVLCRQLQNEFGI